MTTIPNPGNMEYVLQDDQKIKTNVEENRIAATEGSKNEY
jgi:hypothetical protein